MAVTIEHVDKMLQAVREAWLANPKQRLGQLLYNASRMPLKTFYITDASLEKNLNEMRPSTKK